MYLVKTPKFIQNLFPSFTWSISGGERNLFLTFDDGPIPEVTPWVLEQLALYQAKATFFCVGDNVQKHPTIFQQVMEAGHAIGNHTHNHLSGWSPNTLPYFHNIRRCAEYVKSDLFRPPYGKIKPRQAHLLQKHYRIVMWDILSGDFDAKISKEQCLSNVVDKAKAGSIIVLHDSLKAKEKLFFVLPKILQHFSSLGYRFHSLQEQFQSSKRSKTA